MNDNVYAHGEQMRVNDNFHYHGEHTAFMQQQMRMNNFHAHATTEQMRMNDNFHAHREQIHAHGETDFMNRLNERQRSCTRRTDENERKLSCTR